MNKKGKNKKGKVPNPIPQEEKTGGDKTDDLEVIGDTSDLGKTNEITENVVEKNVNVKEERVPEIVSEVVTQPVDKKDEETPKKPKRNRGKKKKGKDDDFDDSIEESHRESSIPVPEETKADNLKVEKELSDVAPVTPTARKKKNKKKSADQTVEETIAPDSEHTTPVALKDIKDSEVTEIKETVTTKADPEPIDQEVKPSKKKNKKKKRNDSERSDKEEISCITAFQKLIDVTDEQLEVKTEEISIENVIPIDNVKAESENQLKKDTPIQKTEIEKDVVSLVESTTDITEENQQISVTEGKNKKKTKKDKKHIPKPEETVPLPTEPSTDIPSSLLDIEKESLSSSIIKEEVSKDIFSLDEPKPESTAEKTSPKPKAKIAKPVEKKRKGKQDNQPLEMPIQEVANEPSKLKEHTVEVVEESPEVKVVEKVIISDIEPKESQQEIPTEVLSLTASSIHENKQLNVEEFEPLNITDRGTKKRKKGAKIPKTPDVSFEISDIKPEICAEIKECNVDIMPKEISQKHIAKDLQLLTKEEQYKATSEMIVAPVAPSLVDTLEEPKPVIELTIQPGIHDHVLLTPEISEEKERVKTETLMPEMVEEILKFETKASKKRKKSPKPPRKNQPMQKSDEILTQETSTISENVQQPDMAPEMSTKIEASNINKMYDIEISSIKADESEGSICDTVPDITYPRCSSQQLPGDNNNNTFIREIFPLQVTSPDTVIQECVKIPKTEGISELKKEASPSKEEKTDLKSKMMEVNQDMEELRLSIERSLAELTSMEKSEEVIEKQFEVSKMKCKDNLTAMSDLTQKEIEPEKNVQVLKTEKCSVEKPVDTPKNIDIAQDKKQIEDLLFSLDIKPPITRDGMQEECSTLKCEKTEIKHPEIPTQGVKYTPPFPKIESDLMAPMTVEKTLTDTLIKAADKSVSNVPEETENKTVSAPVTLIEENKSEQPVEKQGEEEKSKQDETPSDAPPVCPARKDNKNKQKKKKGKQDSQAISAAPTQSTAQSTTQSTTQEKKKEKKADTKSENKGDSKGTQEKGKQQADNLDQATEKDFSDMDYEPIENFEDALTSSVDDVNKTFELIVKQSQDQTNPKINIIAPDEEKTPVSPPKNLLGHPDIPVPSNKRDYKKEKDKIPNEIKAEINIKDATDVERKQSKNTQTIFKLKDMKDCKMSDNEEFVYKYNFRSVFLQSGCHVCNKDVAGARVPCCYCNLVFYCSIKHKDEDWAQHQALCFAVSTIAHLKDQKHIYADAKNITGHDYRLIRMQMIVSCEKVLKRRLVPWEQEALLYPRLCAHVPCREWRQAKLSDCQGCGQLSFCTENPDHYPKSHSRWCKSYSLYQKLVSYQQTKGRLEPRLPTKVMQGQYNIPEKINEVLAGMYEEKIDMNDIQYAALTQLATAPLTAAYCYQMCKSKLNYKNRSLSITIKALFKCIKLVMHMNDIQYAALTQLATAPLTAAYCYQMCKSKNATANGYKKSSFTIHVVGAELQFEADALNKWEVFFLHLRPDLQELKVVLINYNLNPSNLPLELLGKIKQCENCRQNRRRVILSFQDKRSYADYKSSDDFVVPDIVCAFNPSIQRSSIYNGKDPWPSTINVILKQKIPFLLTSYTMTELHKDCIRIKECSETGYNAISEPKYNNFASVRPDRNFISDDEMPLLFKNYCFAIICG